MLAATSRGLREACFGVGKGEAPPAPEAGAKAEEVLKEALLFLRAYLAGKPHPLPPLDIGDLSPFSRRVYRAVLSIPRGETRTYGELACSLGRGSPRAVGRALSRNRLLLFIPCHRVIRSDGRAGSYRAGEEIKIRLLRHEGAIG